MPRIRLIDPRFFTDSALFRCEVKSSLPLRLAFAGLWCCADRHGLFEWKPDELKLDILPYDDVDFAAVLEALAANKFIRRYVVDGHEYGSVLSWDKYQNPHHREKESGIPHPSSVHCPSKRRASRKHERSNNDVSSIHQSTMREPSTVQGRSTYSTSVSTSVSVSASRGGKNGSLHDEAFDQCWAFYPKREGANPKLKARKAWDARLKGGATAEELLGGTVRYLEWCKANGKEGTEFVMQGVRFYGPNREYLEPWLVVDEDPEPERYDPDGVTERPEWLDWISGSKRVGA